MHQLKYILLIDLNLYHSYLNLYYRGAYVTLEKYPDNSWVEVSRFGIRYINKGWSEDNCYFDGYH